MQKDMIMLQKRKKEGHIEEVYHSKMPSLADLNSKIYFVATKKHHELSHSGNSLGIPTLEASVSAPESDARKQSQDMSEFLNDWDIKQVN